MDEAGIDPTLAAVLPLVGVLVGAVLGGMGNYMLRRSDHRVDAHGAARLILTELSEASNVLEWALANGRFPRGDFLRDMRGARWTADALLLTRDVSKADWELLEVAYARLDNVVYMVEAGAAPPDEAERRVREANERVGVAASRLVDLLGLEEDRRRRAIALVLSWRRR